MKSRSSVSPARSLLFRLSFYRAHLLAGLFVSGIIAIPLVWYLTNEASKLRPFQILEVHEGFLSPIAFLPQSNSIITNGSDKTIKKWDLRNGRESISLAECPNGCYSVVSRDGKRVAVSQGYSLDGYSPTKGVIRVYDVSSKRLIRSFEQQGYSTDEIVFSPDGQLLIGATGRSTVEMYDVKSGQTKRLFKKYGIQQLSLSSSGRYLVGGDYTGATYLWDLRTTRLLHSWGGSEVDTPHFHGGEHSVTGCVFLRGEKLLAVSVESQIEQPIRIFDIKTRQIVKTLPTLNYHGISRIALSPDGRTLAGANPYGKVHLWDTKSWLRRGVLDTDERAVTALAFSPDSKVLATGHEKLVKLWNIKDVKE
jgi:WD40 repeat protein